MKNKSHHLEIADSLIKINNLRLPDLGALSVGDLLEVFV